MHKMSYKRGELVNIDDDFGARRPVGRAPTLSSGRNRLRAESPNPSNSRVRYALMIRFYNDIYSVVVFLLH